MSEQIDTKEQLVKIIKEWVKNDNDIRLLQREIKKRKIEKKQISDKLMEVMKSNEIDVFDINDGQIQYSKRTVKKPITKKMLMDILSKYYDGDFMKANELNTFILDNREVQTKETITRKIAKQHMTVDV
jgi:hypothetical protein